LRHKLTVDTHVVVEIPDSHAHTRCCTSSYLASSYEYVLGLTKINLMRLGSVYRASRS